MTTKLQDALTAALTAAKHVGHVPASETVEEFSARRCRDLVEAAGQRCPVVTTDLGVTLNAFCERMRFVLEQEYANPDIPVVELCSVFADGTEFTWKDWCRTTAQNLRVEEVD